MAHTFILTKLALVLAVLVQIVGSTLIAAGDWPTYLHDGQRTADNSSETILSPAHVGQLAAAWSFKTGGPIAASPTVVGGVVYVGSWDGYEYALNASTGGLIWKTFIGQTTDASCSPSSLGVTSSATVQGGIVYVGGGDANWYALDASTGAILWSVYVGDTSAAGGHYNWSSPLIYNSYAYIGVASNCDNPIVQGELLQVNLTGASHVAVHTFNVVPGGQSGDALWTSPAVDPATNTIFVTTGNNGGSGQLDTQAIVALDATTLSVVGSWQIPAASSVTDSDFGTSPILFADQSGNKLVAAGNKNGILYALNRANLGGGPLWQDTLAVGGDNPQGGNGILSSGAFANGVLYFAGGTTTINGTGYGGSVRALKPATGAIEWQHGTAAPVLAGLAYANGLVIDAEGSTLEALNAATGAALWSTTGSATLYGAPTVSNGQIFEGTTNGSIYAYGLTGQPTSTGTSSATITATSTHAPVPPSNTGTNTPVPLTATATSTKMPVPVTNTNTVTMVPPTRTTTNTPVPPTFTATPAAGCATGWTCADVGAPALAGSQSLSGSTWTVQGAGADIFGTADQLHYVWQPISGDGSVSARVTAQQNTDAWAKAGVMFCQDTTAGSAFYAAFVTPGNGVVVQYRVSAGAGAGQSAQLSTRAVPAYLEVARVGSTYTAYTSSDGATWTPVAGSSATLAVVGTVLGGLAVTSHNSAQLGSATFTNVAVGASLPPDTLDQAQQIYNGSLSLRYTSTQTITAGWSSTLARIDLPLCSANIGSSAAMTVTATASSSVIATAMVTFLDSSNACLWYSFVFPGAHPITARQGLRLQLSSQSALAPLWAYDAQVNDPYPAGIGTGRGMTINDFAFRSYVGP